MKREMSDRLTACYAILKTSIRYSKLAIASIFFWARPILSETFIRNLENTPFSGRGDLFTKIVLGCIAIAKILERLGRYTVEL